ncbi:conserved hypothetical protein [Leishmania major strain Friedlin]|uniref:RecQ-mediated genome instability protein 1 n=1 Tax=Leishmania major TaxID=5664 RepID=Q4Q9R3_LEIMA|nr:conserved hypothetical protein [Leishmania major strain Friedlin]CAG9575197.1 hypothetical_protein_-_conserved [Leishmania major strain Friedlin]CAJ05414.1 conserved hypothetical protein [Leishmania major strain Friedlin]|eukprot:XP_001683935.1 conserved hypothetical protein [Leishmania major strain Friedlin]
MTAGTDEATVDYIRSHLDEDLEEVARRPGPPLIRPSLAPFLTPTGLINLPAVAPSVRSQGSSRDLVHPDGTPLSSAAHTVTLVLQVMSVKDVSLSREQRSRVLVHSLSSTRSSSGATPNAALNDADTDTAASLADATLQAMEEQQDEEAQNHIPLRPSGGQWRCLRLELSDGFQRVLAVEDASARTRQRCGVLAKEGITIGAKLHVRLTAPVADTTAISVPCVQHGVLRLHAGNTEVMGGRVRALEVYWETQARQQLAASTGRPSKQQQQQQQYQPTSLTDAPTMSTSAAPAQQHPQPSQQLVVASPVSSPAPPPQQPQSLAALPLQPLRCWPAHAAQHPPDVPFCTVAFITEVVSDMVINEPSPGAAHNGHHVGAEPNPARDAFTYSLLVQLSSPNAVERDTQQQLSNSPSVGGEELGPVSEDDHLTVDLGHAWLHQLVGMPADAFRALSLSNAEADVELLTRTVESVGHALERFGKGRFTLVRRAGDGIVEVMHAEPKP